MTNATGQCQRCGGDVVADQPHVCRKMTRARIAAGGSDRTEVNIGDREPPAPLASTAGADRLVGRVLGGQYRIVSLLGQGGMGAVYVGEHTQLRKQFAIKILSQELAHRDDALARFEMEAVAASALEHENIVNVVNFGREGDIVYLVMELLRGEPLDARIARGPLTYEELVAVTVPICGAMAVAHAAGIVHRDLKPENVFLACRRSGRLCVKLLDFGISKIKEADSAEGRLTHAGQILGSPPYMSPEAAQGVLDLDARTDIYAIGIMLYEMLTGDVPFRAENYLQVLQLHIGTPPMPPSELRPDIPPALEEVVLRALAKDRNERFQTVDELEAALLEALPDIALDVSEAGDYADDLRTPLPMPAPGASGGARTPSRQTPRTPTPRTSSRTPLPRRPALRTPTPGEATPGALASGTAKPGTATARSVTPRTPTPRGATPRPIIRPANAGRLEPSASDVGRSATELAIDPTGLVPAGRRSRRWRWIALGAGASVAIVVGSLVFLGGRGAGRGGGRPASVAAATPGPQPAGAPVAPDATVPSVDRAGVEAAQPAVATITVKTAPPGAAVWLDGRSMGETPLEMKVPRSAQAGRLRIVRAGYRVENVRVSRDADRTIEVTLERVARPQEKAGPANPLDIRGDR